MMQIIGRKEEQQTLLEVFNSKKPEFVVLYGRRRIGKTFLIKEFFKKQRCVLFQVVGVQDGSLKEQLAEFAKAMGITFYQGASILPPNSWMRAFEELTKAIETLAKHQKVVLFFDELPWMATKRSRVLQALDYYWNRYWSNNPNLKLIVCGSSASWIIKNIIQHKGGLHNRYTNSILLRPLTLSETKAFLQHNGVKLNELQILQLYMIMGGIPHYLTHIKKGISAAQTIDNLCFRENGLLFLEFRKLFKSLFEDAKVYIELIRIIAKLREGVPRTYIEQKSRLSTKGGTLTERLNDLELAGFIKSFLPLGHQRQGEYYRVIDEYCYFYLKWIEPIKSTLSAQKRDNAYWTSLIKTAEYQSWKGYTFELVCYKHLSQIQDSLLISGGTKIGTWRYTPKKRNKNERGAQIDLLFERQDDAITICEIKYTDKPFVIDKKCYENILNKIEVYKRVTRTSKQIFVAFIASKGLKQTAYSNELVDGVVTLEDLFRE